MVNILSQSPLPNSIGVFRNIFIQLQVDTSLNRNTVNTNTVILINKVTEEIIPGVVDYIPGTKTLTFQLFDILESNTTYALIVAGGDSGIFKVAPALPWRDDSYIFEFTTGISTDPSSPLAPTTTYPTAPYFTGNEGVYTEVQGRTGEPVSHIVTTAAQVNPSGVIVPIVPSGSVYLTEDEEDDIVLVSTNPSNGAVNIDQLNISLTFSKNVESVDISSKFVITVSNILGYDPDVAFTYVVVDDVVNITVTAATPTKLPYATNFIVTYTDVSDDTDTSMVSGTFSFSTKIKPFYSTILLIRNLRSIIANVSDSDIEKLIYENSLFVFENASPVFDVDTPTQAAKNYVACKTKLDLIQSIYIDGGPIASKKLADFSVAKDLTALPKIASGLVSSLVACVNQNLNTVTNATNTGIATVVMAVNDSRYPASVRLVSQDFE